jgi:hypothetical protein
VTTVFFRAKKTTFFLPFPIRMYEINWFLPTKKHTFSTGNIWIECWKFCDALNTVSETSIGKH